MEHDRVSTRNELKVSEIEIKITRIHKMQWAPSWHPVTLDIVKKRSEECKCDGNQGL